MISYIKERLGSPINNVELMDLHITNSIDQAVDFVNEYSDHNLIYSDFIVLPLSADVDEYNLNDTTIKQISDINSDDIDLGGGINTLFTATNMLFFDYSQVSNSVFNQGAYTTNILTEWNIFKSYLKDVQKSFGRQYRIENYRRYENTVKIVPTPVVDGFAVIRIYKTQPISSLYNEYNVRELSVAYSMLQLSIVLGKYDAEMPGNTRIRIDALTERANSMIEKLETNIREEVPVSGWFIG